MSSDIAEEDMLTYDVIWISGGNSFYLIDIIRRTGFDKKLDSVLEKGVLYAGASAGSQVATISVDVAMDGDALPIRAHRSKNEYGALFLVNKNPLNQLYLISVDFLLMSKAGNELLCPSGYWNLSKIALSRYPITFVH